MLGPWVPAGARSSEGAVRKWALAAALLLLCAPSWGATATAPPQVKIAYGAPGADPNNVHAREILTNSRALEELQAFLAPLRLPVDMNLQAEACGALRRAYDA